MKDVARKAYQNTLDLLIENLKPNIFSKKTSYNIVRVLKSTFLNNVDIIPRVGILGGNFVVTFSKNGQELSYAFSDLFIVASIGNHVERIRHNPHERIRILSNSLMKGSHVGSIQGSRQNSAKQSFNPRDRKQKITG